MPLRLKILIVEDEHSISNFIRTVLTANDFEVITACNGQEAYSMITSRCPDAVLLDLGLPDMDGMKIIRSVREWSKLPIIVVSARTHERDKVDALEAGADDYVLKPFSLHTLGARVRAHLAREERRQRRASVRFSGDVTIDYALRSVTVRGVPVDLTRREFDIAAFLSKHPGQAFDRDRIHEQVGGWENESDPQVVTEHVRRIRRKLAEAGSTQDPIETVWGLGYRWRA